MVAIAFKSRVEHRKQLELEKARKAGLAAAEVDDDGNQINPHIPHYMSSAPWYLNAQKPSLKHQRKWKPHPNYAKSWYDRGATIYQADKYRTGACENCGAMTHSAKSCTERPRKSGAKWTGKRIAPDEKIEQLELDYDGKRDRWNGYDAASYVHVVERYEARRKYLKQEQFKKLEEDDDDEDLEDESKQQIEMTGTVRNLRIREDTAKYLLNLDPNSAHYDPKTRSMREDPLPDMDPKDKFYAGDNHNTLSGEALELKHLHIHMQAEAAPSQAELLYKSYRISKEKLKSQRRDTIMEKYGNAANEETLSRELLLGQSDIQVEYDRFGRIVKGDEMSLSKSKYEEDVYMNNHTSVWGSWWKENVWGYKCCKQTIRSTYCTLGLGR